MLDDTLVVWGGEFGRTPVPRRPHRRQQAAWAATIIPTASPCSLAGGGIKPGFTYGETDELGFAVGKDKVHVHDLQATILHLLGFDHTKLTYRFQGRDFRLTDVAGNVVKRNRGLTQARIAIEFPQRAITNCRTEIVGQLPFGTRSGSPPPRAAGESG